MYDKKKKKKVGEDPSLSFTKGFTNKICKKLLAFGKRKKVSS